MYKGIFWYRMMQQSKAGESFMCSHGPMPYNFFHFRAMKMRLEGKGWQHDMLMRKWQERSWKTYDLYWKTHPGECDEDVKELLKANPALYQ